MKILRLLLVLLMPLPVMAQQWITTASGVRARALASATAEEIARLPIGTLLNQLDNERREATIGDKKDFWYHLSLPNQKANPTDGSKEGWVFGAFLKRFNVARKSEIYREIAATKAKVETGTYAEFADLARFIASVSGEVTERSLQAELELWRWIAIHRALENIPMDKLEQPEYQRFIKSVQPQITYSEPAGMWFVQADVLWNLRKKYADLPVAETIAWEAAQIPIPGECEGDAACGMEISLRQEGRYLQLYPTGKHAEAALDQLIGSFEKPKQIFESDTSLNGGPDAASKRQMRQMIAKLRATYARATSPKKSVLDRHLTRLAALYQ